MAEVTEIAGTITLQIIVGILFWMLVFLGAKAANKVQEVVGNNVLYLVILVVFVWVTGFFIFELF